MKRFFKIAIVSVLTFSVLVFSAIGVFAENVYFEETGSAPFQDYFSIGYLDLLGLTLGTDYTRSQNDNNGYEVVTASAVNPGTNSLTSIVATMNPVKTSMDSIPYGTVLNFSIEFSFELVDSSIDFDDFNLAKVMLKKPNGIGGNFNWGSNNVWDVGTISHLWTGSDGVLHLRADVSFYNTYQDIPDPRFILAFRFKNPVSFNSHTQVYTPTMTRFYFGTGSDPAAPKYPNPSTGQFGGSVNDFKDQEEALSDSTSEGRDSTISLFTNLGDFVSEFASPMLALKGVFDYFVNGTIFEVLLFISLTLGLMSFVFNLVPSMQRKSDRQKNKGGGS